MKKKLSVVMLLILVLVLCFSLTACSEADFNKELLTNGNFEDKVTINGWTPDIKDASKVKYKAQKEDSTYLIINNVTSITSNLYQNVKVEKGATYKISAKYRINSKISGLSGFYLGFLEDANFNANHVYISDGWEDFVIYVTPEMDNLTLSIKLSGKGTVMVDDVSMMKVEPSAVPVGTTVHSIKAVSQLPYGKTPGGITLAVMMTLLTAIIAVGAYYMLRRTASDDKFLTANVNEKVQLSKKVSLSPTAIVGILIFVGFAVRFILAATVYGYNKIYDDAANTIVNISLAGYYYTSPSSIPAGYIYYLGLFGLLKSAVTLNGTMSISIMLKLPSILADIAVIYLIYSFGRKYVGDKNAAIFSAIYAIIPPVFMLNAGWGGIESLAVLGFLAICICIVEKNNIGLFFSTLYSLMFSIDTVYILPLVISYLVIQCIKDKKFIVKAILGIIGVILAFYLITLPLSLPYAKIGRPFIVFTRYYEVLAKEAISCINSFSIYGMIGLNNVLASKASFILSIIFVIFVWMFAIYCYVLKRNRLNLILASAFTMLSISTFAVNQSTVPAVVGTMLLLVYAMLSRDKRVYMLTGGFFVLNAMNIFTIFDMSGYLADNFYMYVIYNKFDWVQVLGSVLMVILVIMLMFVAYDICTTDKRKEIQPIYEKDIIDFKQKLAEKLKIKKAKN